MITIVDSIHWAGIHRLPYVWMLITFVTCCLLWKWYKFHSIMKKLAPKNFQQLLIKHGSVLRYGCKSVCFLLGFGFLLLAWLQPQWDKQEEIVEQEGRDLLIAVDISRSMLAKDQEPNRLEFAKQKIKKLLYNLSCERVALILFSGTTVLQCPLTTDYAAFFMFLDQIDAETISTGTTSIDQSIRQALSIFDKLTAKKTKLLCIFTDGEDFSTNLSGIKEKAAQHGLSIFTFGIGSEHGAPIPILDQSGKQVGFEKDDQGEVIMSKLNEGILKNISKQTGGKYIHATDSDADIQELIQAVDSFEKDTLEDKTVDRLQEKYYYFVAGALLCFLLEWLL